MTPEALAAALRFLGGEAVVRDTLPAGPGISAAEVGEPGPWHGVRWADGTEEGWGREPGVVDTVVRARLEREGGWRPLLDALSTLSGADMAASSVNVGAVAGKPGLVAFRLVTDASAGRFAPASLTLAVLPRDAEALADALRVQAQKARGRTQ